MADFDSSKPRKEGIGTRETGYAGAEYGPFRCNNCVWFDNAKAKYPALHTCSHKEVIADPDVPKTPDGKLAHVEAFACCNHFWPQSRIVDVPFDKIGL